MPTPFPQLLPYSEPELDDALRELGRRIESTSNFHFAWQLFLATEPVPEGPDGAKGVLEGVSRVPECHEFLRTTFDPEFHSAFEIEPLHEHCSMEPSEVRTLAAAATDRVGCHARRSGPVEPEALDEVRRIFEILGPFEIYESKPGQQPDCPGCVTWNHLFTNWFCSNGWDWCFVVLWPGSELAWVGCLSDTD